MGYKRKRRYGKGYGRPSKRARFSRRRRFIKRRSRNRRGRRSGWSNNFSIPNRKAIVCKYHAQYGTIDPGSVGALGTSSVYTLRANSPYDPQYSASGTFNQTAAGYKLWSTLYDHYTVISSKVTYVFRQAQTLSTSVNAADLKVGVIAHDNATLTGSNWVQISANPRARVKTMHMTADSKGYCKITLTFSAKKFFSCANPLDIKDNIGAAVGYNPLDQCFFIPFWQDAAIGTETGIKFNLEIYMTQNVIFSERHDVEALASANAIMQT